VNTLQNVAMSRSKRWPAAIGTTDVGHSSDGVSSPTCTGMESSAVTPSAVVVESSLPLSSVAVVTSTRTAPGPRKPTGADSEKRFSPAGPTVRVVGEAEYERRPDATRTSAPSGAAM
jgi:hypothetical protein